jgi:hypothetical protein
MAEQGKKKRKPSTSPTQLSLSESRSKGCIAQVVERWNPHAKVRQDLFGVIDIVTIGNGCIVGIQATSRTNMSARSNKIKASSEAAEWCNSGGKLLLHGWDKHKNRWRLKCVSMHYDRYDNVWIERDEEEDDCDD